ncbi:hypothetical protein [Thalassovita aquimarina]|uniref:hypothetical protein n=1 Tax=Thalassovita aquimarina TaxID=2785917 RepID=UPI0035615926
MRNALNSMADRRQDGLDPRHDRPVLFSILAETGVGNGFCMEWTLDRLEQREKLS